MNATAILGGWETRISRMIAMSWRISHGHNLIISKWIATQIQDVDGVS